MRYRGMAATTFLFLLGERLRSPLFYVAPSPHAATISFERNAHNNYFVRVNA
jgi:hypothetical protein